MAEDEIYILTKVSPVYTDSVYTESTRTEQISCWCTILALFCIILFLALIGWGLYAIIEAFTPPPNCGPYHGC